MDTKTDGQEYRMEKAQEFYNLFIPFVDTINEMTKNANELRRQFEEVLEVKELKKPSKFKSKRK